MWNSQTLLETTQNNNATLGNSSEVFIKLNTHFSKNPAISLLGNKNKYPLVTFKSVHCFIHNSSKTPNNSSVRQQGNGETNCMIVIQGNTTQQ